ncbi:cell surface protein [Echria macrotheca]|uniref:Cell surface protein n=1 Tax=Echria macrotheca TaxID=438768 RepID=A0AAJ0B7D0_9PEZI|nr:cell surface protein [Echria macrotheca]
MTGMVAVQQSECMGKRRHGTDGSAQSEPGQNQRQLRVGLYARSKPEADMQPTQRVIPQQRPCVVMPLYIYPLTDTTWKPLYDVITTHPTLEFLVIVNPNSGPGDKPLPSPDYVRELPRLSAFPNVRTVGYLAVDYCRKSLAAACEEVSVYAGWARNHEIEGLYVEGIFIDETHNHVEASCTEYFAKLRDHIKQADGLQGERLVIHNPGTPPEYTFSRSDLGEFGKPDVVCVAEIPYSTYITDDVQTRLLTFRLPYQRTMFQISAVPECKIAEVVVELSKKGRYVFVTELDKELYQSFGTCWTNFARALSTTREKGLVREMGVSHW